MKTKIITGLVALNVALAGTLAWRATSNVANAQPLPPQASLKPGKYVMVPGFSRSLSASIVYVFDAANARLGAIAPDNRESFTSMRPIALGPIFENAKNAMGTNTPPNQRPGRGPGPNGPTR